MATEKLFMVLLGCRPEGRNTEQHDVFFGIGTTLKDLIPQMNRFWPHSGGLHIDAWREVTSVDGSAVSVVARAEPLPPAAEKLFFINLGGYKESEFEEFHYKLLATGQTTAEALKKAKKTAFFKHCGISSSGGASHIDDKFGIDVDDVIMIGEALHPELRQKFSVRIEPAKSVHEDQLHIGYIRLNKLS